MMNTVQQMSSFEFQMVCVVRLLLASVCGFAIGIVEALTKGYISTSLADAVVFGILILVLLVKPSGFMGKNVKEKV